MPKIQIPTSLLVYLVIFFLVGYLLYASLYAAVGAMVSTEQEAQQVQAPLTMVIVLSFLLFNVILRDPNSRTAVVLSLVPFLSPILMILRIAMQQCDVGQAPLADPLPRRPEHRLGDVDRDEAAVLADRFGNRHGQRTGAAADFEHALAAG